MKDYLCGSEPGGWGAVGPGPEACVESALSPTPEPQANLRAPSLTCVPGAPTQLIREEIVWLWLVALGAAGGLGPTGHSSPSGSGHGWRGPALQGQAGGGQAGPSCPRALAEAHCPWHLGPTEEQVCVYALPPGVCFE